MILTEVILPRIGFLNDFRAEDAGIRQLDGLHHGRGMDDEEVDGRTSSGITTSTIMSRGLTQSDSGVEPTRRNGDDSHVVVHLDIVVNAVLAVHGVPGDASLEIAVHGGIDEQDAALIGDFSVIQLLSAKVDGGNSTRTSRDVLSSLHAVSRTLGVVTETDGISLRNDLQPHELGGQSTKGHAHRLGVIEAVNEELSRPVILRSVLPPTGSHITTDETTIAGVVTQTDHISLKQIEAVGVVAPAHTILCGVKNSGLGLCLVNLIQQRQILGGKADGIGNGGGNGGSHYALLLCYLIGGRPNQERCLLRASLSASFAVGGAPGVRLGCLFRAALSISLVLVSR